MKVIAKYQNKREEVKAKKQNAKIYPIYKMFSWDLLFFYSIQYLFLTTTKGINASDILKVDELFKKLICYMIQQQQGEERGFILKLMEKEPLGIMF